MRFRPDSRIDHVQGRGPELLQNRITYGRFVDRAERARQSALGDSAAHLAVAAGELLEKTGSLPEPRDQVAAAATQPPAEIEEVIAAGADNEVRRIAWKSRELARHVLEPASRDGQEGCPAPERLSQAIGHVGLAVQIGAAVEDRVAEQRDVDVSGHGRRTRIPRSSCPGRRRRGRGAGG